jgi:hypothetical protein
LSQTAEIFVGDENLVKVQPETAQFVFFFSPSWCIFSSFYGKDGNLGSPAPDRAMLLPWLLKKDDAVDKAASGDKSAQFDAALLARMETGDQAALAALFDRYSRMVLGIAYRVLRDRGESEELVQDIFLYVHQNVARHPNNKGKNFVFRANARIYTNNHRIIFPGKPHEIPLLSMSQPSTIL